MNESQICLHLEYIRLVSHKLVDNLDPVDKLVDKLVTRGNIGKHCYLLHMVFHQSLL